MQEFRNKQETKKKKNIKVRKEIVKECEEVEIERDRNTSTYCFLPQSPFFAVVYVYRTRKPGC